MMNQVLSFAALALGLLATLIAIWHSIKTKRTFVRIKEEYREAQNIVADLSAALAALKVCIEARASIDPAPIDDSHQYAEQLSTLQKMLKSVDSQVSINSNSIAALQQALEAIRPKTEAPSNATPLWTDEVLYRSENLADSTLNPAGTSNLFPPLNQYSAANQPIEPEPAQGLQETQQGAPEPEPYEQVTQQYQDAVNRSDRQALRQLQFKEVNITSESEEELLRGSADHATRLEIVSGGGSYLLVNGNERVWLFPTVLTLDSFSTGQPQKGLFTYEPEILSGPAVKKPAEVKEEGEYWVVVNLGIITTPA